MGDTGNRFHIEPVMPAAVGLLKVTPGQRIRDIACGNGNFSRRLHQPGVRVTTIDHSREMIEAAKRRSLGMDITYLEIYATGEKALSRLEPPLFDAL